MTAKSKKSTWKRLLAFFLILVLLCEVFAFSPSAATVTEAATRKSTLTFGGVNVEVSATLSERADGAYSLFIDLYTAKTHQQVNTETLTAENGTYRVSESGYYLIELWGGRGAAGADTTAYGGSLGGLGGDGGYVRAKVWLERGDTLFYSLGGNGIPTINEDEGGGANGTGGGHGAAGSDTVGGGGGYSALFLYKSNEFVQKYGSYRVNAISEADRISRYIAIAGGGGGGGTGNGNALIGGTATGRANGGAGGSCLFDRYGSISGDGVVAGTFFAGSNGSSSGNSTAYVGRGGSNTPGALPSTWVSSLSGKAPNDWGGTKNSSYAGGAGGTGNLRGGAGGAGFCGGSGGVQTAVVLPSNVGGGGGGSSFLASTVNGRAVEYLDMTGAEAYLKNQNPSDEGGAFCITFLGERDVSFLSDVTIECTVSEYFVPARGEENGEDGAGYSYDPVTRELRLSGISLLTDEGEIGGELTAEVYYGVLYGFAGGNNVPLFEGEMWCSATVDGELVRHAVDLTDCDHVNIPLRFPIRTHSFLAGEPGEVFEVADFYTDYYQGIRSVMASDRRYDFIRSIGYYNVLDPSGNVVTGTVSPQKTTAYRVYFDVVLKDTGVAAVGTPCKDTRVSGIATVEVMSSISDMLGAFEVTYTKQVTYNGDGTYTFSLNMTSGVTKEGEILPDEGVNHHQHYSATADSFEHPVAVSGYYLVRAYGGDGGTAAGSILGADGGIGGAGAYVAGYVYLNKGEYVTGSIGGNGTSPGGTYTAGGGGDYTYIKILNADKSLKQVLMVAGGGGGGGGGIYWSDGGAGKSSTSYTPTFDATLSEGVLTAYHGKAGNNSAWYGPGAGGEAGACYKAPELYSLDDLSRLNEEARYSLEEALKNTYDPSENSGGAFFLHMLQSDRGVDTLVSEADKILSEYSLHAVISKYFEVKSVIGYNAVADENGDTALEMTYTPVPSVLGESTVVSISEIDPYITAITTSSESETHVHSMVDFTVEILLAPAEGFMGGNDVPIFDPESDGGMRLSHIQYYVDAPTTYPEIALVENVATDYLNVAIDYEPPVLRATDRFIVAGQSLRPVGDLFLLDGPLPLLPEGADDLWEYDFVDFWDTYSTLPERVAPLTTTTYTVEIGISPKAEPTKAVVAAAAERREVIASATVYVGYRVVYELDALTTSDTPTEGQYYVGADEDYTARLIPDEGRYLPDRIAVSVGGTLLAEDAYTYNAETGEFSIPAAVITDTVTITATAAAPRFSLHFIYMTAPGGNDYVEITETYEEGASLADAAFHALVPAEFTGYEFLLDFGNGATDAPTVMPDRDVWVIGYYAAREYTLSILYRDENGDPLLGAPDAALTVAYGESYSVQSPVLDGYLADRPLVEGVMPAESITVDVIYSRTDGSLHIVYMQRLPDGSLTELDRYERSGISVGTAFSVDSPVLVGYRPDADTVSGVMVADGVTVYVTYSPERYRVSFGDPDGGNTYSDILVYYDNVYGYQSKDGLAFSYTALPTPVRTGYTFVGWMLDDILVTEETVVATVGAHTLTACWEAERYTVTVRYQYANGEQVFEDRVSSLAFGSEYRFDTPSLYGYTADKLSISGTVPAQNVLLLITYAPNGMTVTIEYVDAADPSVSLAPTVVLPLVHGQAYEVASPAIPGYSTVSMGVVSGVADAPRNGLVLTYTVYYYEDEPIISVTVSWGALRFDLTERGIWDPELHDYREDTVAPNGDSNYVTVQNDTASTIAVRAGYAYERALGFDDFTAYFTAAQDKDAAAITESGNLAPGASFTAFVWLKGHLPPDFIGSAATLGTCTVIIEGGNQS